MTPINRHAACMVVDGVPMIIEVFSLGETFAIPESERGFLDDACILPGIGFVKAWRATDYAEVVAITLLGVQAKNQLIADFANQN